MPNKVKASRLKWLFKESTLSNKCNLNPDLNPNLQAATGQ
jgi:hypothetical protein